MKFEFIQTKQSGEGESSGGKFLKIGEGKSLNVVFRGNPYKFWQTWPLGGVKQVFHEPTAGASLRFRINVVVYEDGKFVAKIWEFPPTANNTLFEISKSIDLSKSKCKITRSGSGKKTQWIIIPLGPLDAKALKQVEDVELLPLEPKEQSAPLQATGTEGEGLPF